MPKVRLRDSAKDLIARDAAAFLVNEQEAAGDLVPYVDQEDLMHAIRAELDAQPAGDIPDGAMPGPTSIGLQCGLGFIVDPSDLVFDIRKPTIVKPGAGIIMPGRA